MSRFQQIPFIFSAFITFNLQKFNLPVEGLNNGLALTPPMGWLSWERFRCNTDCLNDPHNCISERLFEQMSDILAKDGYLDVGYSYISIDDCWLEHNRDSAGRLQPDKKRFPKGIKALADYVHSRGLKFGIYEDYGNFTCAGYPGILGHLQTDAETFADWDVDYVKLDGCYALPKDMDEGYPAFGRELNATGRPMVYSCSWPVYQTYSGLEPDYSSIISSCNLWRNFDDIQDSWASVASIIDYYGDNQDKIIKNAGPGHWNDPDMLIIGNFGLSYEQSKTQMAMWAIFAAPLLMSVDLRTIKPEYKAILQNVQIIKVDQDRLGIQGRRIYKQKGIEIWTRPLEPIFQGKYSYGIVFLNRRTDGTPSEVSVTLAELGLSFPGGYHVTDLFDNYDYGIVTPDRRFKVDVNPSGSVVMIRADIYQGSLNTISTSNRLPKQNFPLSNSNSDDQLFLNTGSLTPRIQSRRDVIHPSGGVEDTPRGNGYVLDHGHIGYLEDDAANKLKHNTADPTLNQIQDEYDPIEHKMKSTGGHHHIIGGLTDYPSINTIQMSGDRINEQPKTTSYTNPYNPYYYQTSVGSKYNPSTTEIPHSNHNPMTNTNSPPQNPQYSQNQGSQQILPNSQHNSFRDYYHRLYSALSSNVGSRNTDRNYYKHSMNNENLLYG